MLKLRQSIQAPANRQQTAGNSRQANRYSRVLLSAVCCLLFIAHCPRPAGAQDGPSVTVRPTDDSATGVLLLVDEKVVEASSLQVQRGQQVMIWIRDLEKLGWGTVTIPGPDRISLKSDSVTLTFIKNHGVAMVNSLAVRLPIDTYVRDGKFMVPLSFVAKALGYRYDFVLRPVVSISTAPEAAQSARGNTLQGKVTYGGEGAAGITVRAVDSNFTVVSGAFTKTDPAGQYTISNLPDGDYMAYVYTGDNPQFFNRASKLVRVEGGKTYRVDPIPLGRIITPVTPAVGANRVSLGSESVTFAWKPIEKAAKYKLVIREPGSEKWVYSTESTKPEVRVPAAKLRAGCTYEAQVTALDAAGGFLGGTAGAGGKPWVFTTAP